VKKVIAFAGTAAVLVAGAALAAAAPQTIAFTSVTASQKQTKTGFTSVSNDFQGKTKVGQDRLKCIFKGNVGACAVTVTRSDGTIKAAFTIKGNPTGGPLKVVGGTGAYAGAGGTGTYKNLNKSGSRTAVTLKLA
jgi:hypothetical protein